MWTSPDGKISKVVILEGDWGQKPSEWSQCEILISDSNDESLTKYSSVIIGDSDNYFRRTLDICLCTMNQKEVAKVTVSPTKENISFTIQLHDFKSNGFIYQWSPKTKMEIALRHKESGVELFKQSRSIDAAHRFVKAIKVVSSIPISCTEPKDFDDVTLQEISALKANLYNNLATYFYKEGSWLKVIDLCKKVFRYDRDNVKAHYKIAIAYNNERHFEEAETELLIVLKLEPCNKAASEYLKTVREEIRKDSVLSTSIVKKMFDFNK